jgi:hypothetical protein
MNNPTKWFESIPLVHQDPSPSSFWGKNSFLLEFLRFTEFQFKLGDDLLGVAWQLRCDPLSKIWVRFMEFWVIFRLIFWPPASLFVRSGALVSSLFVRSLGRRSLFVACLLFVPWFKSWNHQASSEATDLDSGLHQQPVAGPGDCVSLPLLRSLFILWTSFSNLLRTGCLPSFSVLPLGHGQDLLHQFSVCSLVTGAQFILLS